MHACGAHYSIFTFPPLNLLLFISIFIIIIFEGQKRKQKGRVLTQYACVLSRFASFCRILHCTLDIHTHAHTHTHTHTHTYVVDFYQIYEDAQIPHTKAHSTDTKKYPTSPHTRTHTLFLASECTLSHARFARARQHTHQHTHTYTYILKMSNSYAPFKRERLQS